VTASAFKEQRKQMLDAGMDDVVGKPYRSEEIYACLSKQLGLKFQYEALDEPQDQIGTLTAEMFNILPETLCNELQAALQSLERDRIDQVISRVGEHDLVLQRTLARFVEGYNYPAILRLLVKE
jgi:CheY-like chemotaxis protein